MTPMSALTKQLRKPRTDLDDALPAPPTTCDEVWGFAGRPVDWLRSPEEITNGIKLHLRLDNRDS